MKTETCVIRDMGQCNCANSGECWSFNSEARQKQRTAERTVRAKHNAWRVMLVALAVASICAFAGATAHTVTKMERQHELQARI